MVKQSDQTCDMIAYHAGDDSRYAIKGIQISTNGSIDKIKQQKAAKMIKAFENCVNKPHVINLLNHFEEKFFVFLVF